MKVIEGGFKKEEKGRTTLKEHLDHILEVSDMKDDKGVRYIIVLENEQRHTIVSNYKHIPDANWALDCAKHFLFSGVSGK